MSIQSHASHKEKYLKIFKKKKKPITVFYHRALDEELINLQF